MGREKLMINNRMLLTLSAIFTLVVCQPATSEVEAGWLDDFEQINRIALRVAAKPEACIDPHFMRAMIALGEELTRIDGFESVYSMATEARRIRALQLGTETAEIPDDKYELLYAINSLNVSSGLFNADCSIHTLFLNLKPNVLSYRHIENQEGVPYRILAVPDVLTRAVRKTAVKAQKEQPTLIQAVQPNVNLPMRIAVLVESNQGSIYNLEYFKILKAVTDEVFFLPGVDRSTVISLFTPYVRYWDFDPDGNYQGGNVIPADYSHAKSDIERVKQNVNRSLVAKRLIDTPRKRSIVWAEILIQDPVTDQRLDLTRFNQSLQQVVAHFTDENHKVAVQVLQNNIHAESQQNGSLRGFFSPRKNNTKQSEQPVTSPLERAKQLENAKPKQAIAIYENLLHYQQSSPDAIIAMQRLQALQQ